MGRQGHKDGFEQGTDEGRVGDRIVPGSLSHRWGERESGRSEGSSTFGGAKLGDRFRAGFARCWPGRERERLIDDSDSTCNPKMVRTEALEATGLVAYTFSLRVVWIRIHRRALPVLPLLARSAVPPSPADTPRPHSGDKDTSRIHRGRREESDTGRRDRMAGAGSQADDLPARSRPDPQTSRSATLAPTPPESAPSQRRTISSAFTTPRRYAHPLARS